MMEVEEEMPINMKIGEVIAIDKDIGKNAVIDYAIICKIFFSSICLYYTSIFFQMAMIMEFSASAEMIKTEASSPLTRDWTEKRVDCIP